MRYLVTGGAGFIGSNIVKRLLELGQDVVVLDNFATGKRENILKLMYNAVNSEQGTVNGEQGTVNGEQLTVNSEKENNHRLHPSEVERTGQGPSAVNGEQGRVNGEQGTVNGEQGTVNGEQGTVNGEQGTVNSEKDNNHRLHPSEVEKTGQGPSAVSGEQLTVNSEKDNNHRLHPSEAEKTGLHGAGELTRIKDDVGCKPSAVNGEQGKVKNRIENGELRIENEKKEKDNNHRLHKLTQIKSEKRGNLEVIEGDLRSFHIVRSAVKSVDYILHQGALPSVPRSINDPITSNDVNILGTLNILEAAKEFEVKRVVLASSSSIYGNSEILPKVETMPVNPMSPYALTKYTQERYCQVFYDLYGLETVCLRYFNVFGPNQDPTSQYSAVIPKFIKKIMYNERPVIYGDGSQSRDFTYVENNVEANLLACTAENVAGEVINIACGERYTLIELVEMINKILGKNIEPIFEKDRAGDVKHSLADIEKAKRLLGYEVKVGFEEGLRRAVEGLSKE